MMLIINGRVVDPVTGTDDKMDILIDGGIIRAVGKPIDLSDVEDTVQILDAEGLVVAPGLMDAHVHFRDPGLTDKEDIRTGATAAARGGFRTVV